jgi:CTP synthase
LCLGLHVMVIEFARYVLDSREPNSTEFASSTRYPVIDLLPEQKNIKDKGATMRLGNYPCKLVDSSRAARAYGQSLIQERHRHRFEFNNEYREQLEKAGMTYSGLSPDDRLVEICELADHPWMVSCQFHPEFLSRPGRPHPLFRDFVGVAKDILREGDQPPLPLTT